MCFLILFIKQYRGVYLNKFNVSIPLKFDFAYFVNSHRSRSTEHCLTDILGFVKVEFQKGYLIKM